MQAMQQQARSVPAEVVRTVSQSSGAPTDGTRDPEGGWVSGPDEAGGDAVTRVVASHLVRVEPVQGSSSLTESNSEGAATKSVRFYDVHFPEGADVRQDDRIAVPGYFKKRRQETAYARGDVVVLERPDGRCYRAIQSGTTAETHPAFKPQGATTDGTVVWIPWMKAQIFEVKGTNASTSIPDDYIVRVELIT